MKYDSFLQSSVSHLKDSRAEGFCPGDYFKKKNGRVELQRLLNNSITIYGQERTAYSKQGQVYDYSSIMAPEAAGLIIKVSKSSGRTT
jgi:hypothetical protein